MERETCRDLAEAARAAKGRTAMERAIKQSLYALERETCRDIGEVISPFTASNWSLYALERETCRDK